MRAGRVLVSVGGAIAAGLFFVVVIGGSFIATQIQLDDGRTLADRIPVVGPVVRFIGLTGGAPGEAAGPSLIVPPDPAKVLRQRSCDDFRNADRPQQDVVIQAFAIYVKKVAPTAAIPSAEEIAESLFALCAQFPGRRNLFETFAAAAASQGRQAPPP